LAGAADGLITADGADGEMDVTGVARRVLSRQAERQNDQELAPDAAQEYEGRSVPVAEFGRPVAQCDRPERVAVRSLHSRSPCRAARRCIATITNRHAGGRA
jgi:hypothetical protein